MDREIEILEWIPDAVVVTNRTGAIVFANARAETLTGYARAELVGRQVELLIPETRRESHVGLRRDFYRRGVARAMGHGTGDFTLRRKDGTEVPVDISLGPAGKNTVAVVRDVTERRLMEAALEHRALHDPLTDLPNRTLFFDRLDQAMLSAQREAKRVAVVMIDLDNFKAVNDTRGHAFGDEVLKKMAARLRDGLRASDTAARLGGDEFAWILPGIAGRAAAQATVRARLAAAGRRTGVRCSAGIAVFPDDGADADTLLRHADAALYAAKRKRKLTAP